MNPNYIIREPFFEYGPKCYMYGDVLLDMAKGLDELAEKYEVTEETIRRDIEKLESEGYAKKTYGGAVRNDNMTSELPYTVRKQTNVGGKKYIAEIIGSLISDGDSL